MGKGNLFLGYGRGKVGDVVFSRTNGEQTFRARNRNPRNPRSNKQLIQRAIMATIMHAYSAGRDIFDHAFQGYTVGEGCQRRFMTLNLNHLRSQLSTDYGNETMEECLAKTTAPGIATVVPNEYIVSEGNYDQRLWTLDAALPIYNLPAPPSGSSTTVKAYAASVGLLPGDIYTFILVSTSKADADVLFKARGNFSLDTDIVYRGSFSWCRLVAKAVDQDETVVTGSTLITQLFDVELGGLSDQVPSAATISSGILAGDFLSSFDSSAGFAYGCIRSRRDQDLRSTSQLKVFNPAEFGLWWDALLVAWKAGTTPIGESDLILEGGEGE